MMENVKGILSICNRYSETYCRLLRDSILVIHACAWRTWPWWLAMFRDAGTYPADGTALSLLLFQVSHNMLCTKNIIFFLLGTCLLYASWATKRKWALLQCDIRNENPVKPLKIGLGHVSLTFCIRLLILFL